MRDRDGGAKPDAGRVSQRTPTGAERAAEVPVVNDEAQQQRLESLRRAIAAGEYSVSAEALAERLIARMERR